MKERWDEACLVPEGASFEQFRRVCERLVELRGDRFERGFVVRKQVPLRFLEQSPFGRPVFEEYRLFFFRGELVSSTIYDRVGGSLTEFARFHELGKRVPSPFFSADVGRMVSGELVLIELGDGGVSRLPPRLDIEAFYAKLKARWAEPA